MRSSVFVLSIIMLHFVRTPALAQPTDPVLGQDIVYIGSDLNQAAVFTGEEVRFGPTDLTLYNPDWPRSPVRYSRSKDDVECLSVGLLWNSNEYAIKRPIKLNETYKCQKTSFRVTRCFYQCNAAIIEIKRPLSNNMKKTRKAYMYVEGCRGIIIFSEDYNIGKGIPLDAKWLRGSVGVLADKKYPDCSILDYND